MSMRINYLPAPTWNWLKMNFKEVDEWQGKKEDAKITLPEGVTLTTLEDAENSDKSFDFNEVGTGMGPEIGKIIDDSKVATQRFVCEENREIETPVFVDLNYDGEDENGNQNYVNSYEVLVKENSSATFVFCYSSKKKSIALNQVKFIVEKNAKLSLVQLHMLGDEFNMFSDVGVRIDENANVSQVNLFIGGEKIYNGFRADLAGKYSSIESDYGYIVKGEEELDINYVANHLGKKTNSDILVNGVLRDKGKKMFRGTIDLRRGGKEAVGAENEDVLMIDEGVRNQTVPLILCTEEDVSGTHGATIGKIDEDLMFYLQSRGLAKEYIYEMMAEARIKYVINKIENENLRNRCLSFLGYDKDVEVENEVEVIGSRGEN